MGQMTRMQIEAWQKNAGLNVPSLKIIELWRRLQNACIEAFSVAELEKSGIRDGDSSWHGGDVLSHTWADLETAVAHLREAYDTEYREHLRRNGIDPDAPIDLSFLGQA